MCGIAGFYDPKISREESAGIIGSMLESIGHRGPDARVTWQDDALVLGHNRLSIIDLSEQANQPMVRDNLTLIFNGEIYNYIEIRERLLKEGFTFSTQSDTEVILAAYRKWGDDCVKEFAGMWALVIWDHKEKRLFASRDRFGIKPFYYMQQGDRFYFGSEFKALKKSPVFNSEINLNQVSRGLQMGWTCYHDETYFEKIKALPAAHNLVYHYGKVTVNRYWDIETGKYAKLSFDEKKERFFNLFSESIRLHMRSDVPVASCLSGGLDSSAIVSLVQKLNPGSAYKTFSIYYEGKDDVDERPFIYDVIKKYPGVDPYYFSPTEDDIQNSFHRALYHADVPCTGSSFISQYFLMELISRHKIKVVLDGQGSDEYLAGYMHTFYRLIADDILSGKISNALKLTREINRNLGSDAVKTFAHFGKSLLCTMNDEQDLYGLEYKNYFPFMSKDARNMVFNLKKVNGNKTDNFLYHQIFATSLPSLLQYEDRNSMAFSIESRVPFLDHRLVEFSFGLKNEDKVNGTETKYILRKALSGILPKTIEERKDKKGFVTPGENKWLRGPLKHLIDDNFKVPDFLKKDVVTNIISQYRQGDNSKAQLAWRLAVLNYWLKNFAN
jgi:asparagine synthase (glutamine-hydrolysing)